MYLFNIILLALIARSCLAKNDGNGQIMFVKRVDTGLPDLNEPATQSHIGGHTEGSPSISHSSSNLPSFGASHPSTLGDRTARKAKKAQERREKHREYMKVKRKTMKETFENRHKLGFSEKKIKEMEIKHEAEKSLKNERTRTRNKASRERVKKGNPTQTDLNFVASQKASSAKWHANHPEKAAKAKRAWAQRNPEKILAASKKRLLKKKEIRAAKRTRIDFTASTTQY